MEWKLREEGALVDPFDPQDGFIEYFTIKFHHGGKLVGDEKKKYIGGKVSYVDFCDGDLMSLIEVSGMLAELGYKDKMYVYCLTSDNSEFKAVKTDNDVMEFCNWGQVNKVVQLYCELPQDQYDDLPEHMGPVEDELPSRIADDDVQHAGGIDAIDEGNWLDVIDESTWLEWPNGLDAYIGTGDIRTGEASVVAAGEDNGTHGGASSVIAASGGETSGLGKRVAQVGQNKSKKRKPFAQHGDWDEVHRRGVEHVDDRMKHSRQWEPLWNGAFGYQVTGPNAVQFAVDIRKKECTCKLWALSGVPCVHAIVALKEANHDPYDYTDQCYKVETFHSIYEHVLFPINSMEHWPKSDMLKLDPPIAFAQPGRPRKARRRDITEGKDHGKKKRLKKIVKMHCGKCGGAGHNKATCKGAVMENDANIDMAQPTHDESQAHVKRKKSSTRDVESGSQPQQIQRKKQAVKRKTMPAHLLMQGRQQLMEIHHSLNQQHAGEVNQQLMPW